MSSFAIKSSSLLVLIITLVCFSYGNGVAPFKLLSGAKGVFQKTDEATNQLFKKAQKLTDKNFGLAGEKAKPGVHYPKYVEHTVQQIGESIAMSYFGKEGVKGFRWGWKAGKRILAVEKKCDKLFEQAEKVCSPDEPDANASSHYCIIEVGKKAASNTYPITKCSNSDDLKDAPCSPYATMTNPKFCLYALPH